MGYLKIQRFQCKRFEAISDISSVSLLSPADAKDNGFLPAADALTNLPPISRPLTPNSEPISNQNDEFEFLESTTKEIILVKDTSGNFFAEGFTPPFPRRPSSTGSQTATGMKGQNPGQGGGNSNPGSVSKADSCSSNPTPKATPEGMNYGLGSPPKNKKLSAK